MTPEQREKRKRIMKRSMLLGHCVCDVQKPCPCPVFKEHDVCQCAGEHLTIEQSGPVRLTEHVRSAGCASKISKKVLKEVLGDLPVRVDPRVLSGSNDGDDAGVVMLNDNDTAVLTVDVFTPSVDDPYTFGQIAAANSVSDIYAMGAKPLAALSIIGFPVYELPLNAMREMLRGGADKLNEAGISVVGGHSINDVEVKCGFAVFGTAKKEKFVRNAGACPGDKFVLTKPLGNGIIAFASQLERASEESKKQIADAMATLNKYAAEAADDLQVHAMTDVTGFSLLGHLVEIVKNSRLNVSIDFDALPFFEGVQTLARQDVFTGAVERNRESVPSDYLDFSSLNAVQSYVLFSPETSGGLLMSLPADQADILVQRLHAQNRPCWIIGEGTNCSDNPKISVRTHNQDAWSPLEIKKSVTTPETEDKEMSQSACCSSEKEPEKAQCCCSEQSQTTARPNPANGPLFSKFMGAAAGNGTIDLKHKKLMAVALSVCTRCQPCTDANIAAARAAGASDVEIAEAVDMGVAFGGAPALMAYKQG